MPEKSVGHAMLGRNHNGERRSRMTAFESSALDERSVAQLGNGLLKLSLRIHNDRPVPCDRLLDRLAGDQQESDAVLAGLHGDLVAAVEQHKRAVAGPLRYQDLIVFARLFGQDAERRRRLAECPVGRSVSTGKVLRRPGGTQTSVAHEVSSRCT